MAGMGGGMGANGMGGGMGANGMGAGMGGSMGGGGMGGGMGGMGSGMGGGMGGGSGMMTGSMNGMNSGSNAMMTNSYGGGNGSLASTNTNRGPPGRTPAPMGMGMGVGMGMGIGESDDGEEAVVYQIVYGKPGPMGIDLRPHSVEYSLNSGQKGDDLFYPFHFCYYMSRSLLHSAITFTYPLNLHSPRPLPFRRRPCALSKRRSRWFTHKTRRYHGQYQRQTPRSR